MADAAAATATEAAGGATVTQTVTEAAKTADTTAKIADAVEIKGQDTLLGDAKAADTKTADAAKTDDKAKTAEPAKIDVKAIKLPDGFTADEAALGPVAELLSNTELPPQERMQKLVDLHAEAVKKASEASTQAYTDLNKKWVDAVKADAEIGGAKLDSTVKPMIGKVIDSLGKELAGEVRAALNLTGAGNNPAIVKAFYKFAEKLVEGGHVTGGPSDTKSLKETFFPNSPQMK